MTKKECENLNYGDAVESNGQLFKFKFLAHGTSAVVAGDERDYIINRKLLKLPKSQVKSD